MAAVDELGLEDQIDFISTGGGASLELLEYGDLPGLAALRGAVNAPPRRRTRRTISPTGDRRHRRRRPLISGNWKMNFDHLEALHAVRDLGLRLQPADAGPVDMSVHPPFTDIRTVQSVIEPEGIPVSLGAQNCAIEDRGAFTGEVSAADAGQAARRVRDRRAFRAPPDVRRVGRGGGGQAAGRPAQRHDPDLLRGGDPRGAGAGG